MNLVWTGKVLDVAARAGQPIEAEVQVVALGKELAWVSLPGEVFVQLGLDLKLDSPFATTIVAELSNGGIGYIPNRRAYPQGNYEVVSARCAEGSGEMLIQAAGEGWVSFFIIMLTFMVPPRCIGLANTFIGHPNPTIWLAAAANTPSSEAYLRNSRRESFPFCKSSLSS